MNAQERRLDAAMKEIDLSYGYWPAEVREVIDALVERAEQAEAIGKEIRRMDAYTIGTIRKENPVTTYASDPPERTETHTVTEETTETTEPLPDLDTDNKDEEEEEE